MTERIKIAPGLQRGNLTVVSATARRKNGYTVWLCQCYCGGQIELDTRTLQRGTVRDCGCRTKVKPGQRDLSGQRFGRLTALESTGLRDASGATVWRCRCDCGNEVLTSLSQLTQGYKKSCGCLINPPVQDIQGQQFGDLRVIGFGGKKDGQYYWRCQCKCGKTATVRQNNLVSGKTKSCGCLQAKVIVDNMKFVDGTSVTLLENAEKRLISTNTSGHNGVYWNKKSGKWVAQIGFKGKTYYLGSFGKIEDAVKARERAEEQIYGEFLEWYYETHTVQTIQTTKQHNDRDLKYR